MEVAEGAGGEKCFEVVIVGQGSIRVHHDEDCVTLMLEMVNGLADVLEEYFPWLGLGDAILFMMCVFATERTSDWGRLDVTFANSICRENSEFSVLLSPER